MRSEAMMKDFRDCLSACGLEDMGFLGDPFTCKRRVICEMLDREVAMVNGP